MLRQRIAFLTTVLVLACAALRAERIESLVTIFGAEPTHIEGHALVTGLKGTGDKSAAAIKLLKQYLEKYQIALDETDLSSKNIALVKVDAEVPPFARPGHKLDIRVSALNDASSLEGGVLQQCVLRARPDGPVYAVASGRVIIGNANLHPTTGVIPANSKGGAQLLKLIPTKVIEDDSKFRLNLKRESHEDAAAIAQAINASDTLNPYKTTQLGFADVQETRKIAWALDAGQVIVQIPESKQTEQVRFIAEVLKLNVPVARPARVLFNRQSRTVILSGDVLVDPVAISHNNRFVTLADVDQGPGLGTRKEYTLDDQDERRLIELDGHRRSLPNLAQLIDTLNAMGTTPEDMVAILQKMKAAGALHAELIVE